jgi:hypothetical protein
MSQIKFDNYQLDFEEMRDDTILKKFSVEDIKRIQLDKQSGLNIYIVKMREIPDGEWEDFAIQSYPPLEKRYANMIVNKPYRRNKRSGKDSQITDVMIINKFTVWVNYYEKK